MKGNNKFIFNHATMIEAMQLYLDNTLAANTPVKVTAVSENKDGQTTVFEVETSTMENDGNGK